MNDKKYELRWSLRDSEGNVSHETITDISMGEYIQLLSTNTKEIVSMKLFELPISYKVKDYKDLPVDKLFITNGVLVKYDGENLQVSLHAITNGGLNWTLVGEKDEWFALNKNSELSEVL